MINNEIFDILSRLQQCNKSPEGGATAVCRVTSHICNIIHSVSVHDHTDRITFAALCRSVYTNNVKLKTADDSRCYFSISVACNDYPSSSLTLLILISLQAR